jgi:hypothetical protein
VWSSLRESAAAYTASYGRQHVLRLRRVQLFTGEEKESNVVQVKTYRTDSCQILQCLVPDGTVDNVAYNF